MYPQYPAYGYTSGYVPEAYMAPVGYVPVQYAPHYPEPAQQRLRPPAPPPLPVSQRLMIRDPKTGAAVTGSLSEQLENALANYRKHTAESDDLANLDLVDIFKKCQAFCIDHPDFPATLNAASFPSGILRTAANQGLPNCQYYLGRCYETGQGDLPGDQSMCRSCFVKASDLGIQEASYKLGQCYEDGWGCTQSMSQAIRLYQLAADGGVLVAKVRLGFLYEEGNGLEQDLQVACKMYQQAVNMAEGAFHTGRCYEHGIGIAVNLGWAKRWYEKAAELGSPQAHDCLYHLQGEPAVSDAESVSSDKTTNSAAGNASGSPTRKAGSGKPDPEAKPFVPATSAGGQDGTSSSTRPNLTARPFIPVPSPTKRGSSVQTKGEMDTAQSISTSTRSVPRKVPKFAPPAGTECDLCHVKEDHLTEDCPKRLPQLSKDAPKALQKQGKAQLTAQAPVFQPKEDKGLGSAGAQPAGKDSSAPTKQQTKRAPLSRAAAPDSASLEAQQKECALGSNADAAEQKTSVPSAEKSAEEMDVSDTPVEDLDMLHTEQMATAWAALEAATHAEPAVVNDIRSAIRQAKPYKELAHHIRGAEGYLHQLMGSVSGSLHGICHAQHTPAQRLATAGSDDAVPVPRDVQQPDGEADTTAEENGTSGQDISIAMEGKSRAQAAAQAAQQDKESDPAEASALLQQQSQLADQAPLVAPSDEDTPGRVPDRILQSQEPIQSADTQMVSLRKGTVSPEALASAKAAALLALGKPVPSPAAARTASSAASSQSGSVPDKHTVANTKHGAAAAAAANSSSLGSDALHDGPVQAEAETAVSSGALDHQPDGAWRGSAAGDPSGATQEVEPSAATQAPDIEHVPSTVAGPAAVPASGGNSMSHFLSFLLPAENPSAHSTAAPKPIFKQPPPGFSSPVQEQKPAASQPLAQPSQVLQDSAQASTTRRAKAYMSVAARAPVAYRPPGNPSFDPQQPHVDDLPQHQQGPDEAVAQPEQPLRHEQRQTLEYLPLQQPQPAVYDPAQQQNARNRPGRVYKPAAAPAYNPPGAPARADSPCKLDAEKSTDDVLAELFGLSFDQAHQAAPAVQAASESDLDLDALLTQEQGKQPAVSVEQKAAAAAAQPTKGALQANSSGVSEGRQDAASAEQPPAAAAVPAPPPPPPRASNGPLTSSTDKPEQTQAPVASAEEQDDKTDAAPQAEASMPVQQTGFSGQDSRTVQHDTIKPDASGKASSQADTDSQADDNQASSSRSEAGSHSTAAEQADVSLPSEPLATKKSAADADYSVSNAKAARKKAKPATSPGKAPAAAAGEESRQSGAAAPPADDKAAAAPTASGGDLQRPALVRNTSSSSLDAAHSSVFMPPKPKPGGNRARPAQPAVERDNTPIGQAQYVVPLLEPATADMLRKPSPSLPAALHHSQAAAASAWQQARAQAQEQQQLTSAPRQQLQQNKSAARPQRQQSQDRIPAAQRPASENRSAAPPQARDSSAQHCQQVDDGWETVGHKGGPKQQHAYPARQPSPPARPSPSEPPTQAADYPMPMPGPEAPAAQQRQSGADLSAAAPVTLAPNSAWAKKLALQPGAGSSAKAAAPSVPPAPSSKPEAFPPISSSKPEAAPSVSEPQPQTRTPKPDLKPQVGVPKASPKAEARSPVPESKAEAGSSGVSKPDAKAPMSTLKSEAGPSVPASKPGATKPASEAKAEAGPSEPGPRAEAGPAEAAPRAGAGPSVPPTKPEAMATPPGPKPEANSSEGAPSATALNSEAVPSEAGPSGTAPEGEAEPSEPAAQAEPGPSEPPTATQAAAQQAGDEPEAPRKKKNRGRKKRGAGPLQQEAQAGPSQEPAGGVLAAIESDAARAANAAPNILGASAEEKVQKQQQAMMTIAADSMRVTAANKDAWIEICTCPLSLDIMEQPVVAADGITYEREDITQWLKNNSISPWTRGKLENKDLTPNLLVEKLITKFNLYESGQ